MRAAVVFTRLDLMHGFSSVTAFPPFATLQYAPLKFQTAFPEISAEWIHQTWARTTRKDVKRANIERC